MPNNKNLLSNNINYIFLKYKILKIHPSMCMINFHEYTFKSFLSLVTINSHLFENPKTMLERCIYSQKIKAHEKHTL